MGGESREAAAATVAESDVRVEIDVRDEHGDDRLSAVRKAVGTWRRQLIDTSGNNRLLSYRDMAVGTLNLTPHGDSGARPEGVDALLRGEPVRLSAIFPIETADAPGPRFADALRRVSNIAHKARIVHEEKGLDTLFVALGLARWRPPDRGRPNAPVLLLPVTAEPVGGAGQEYVLCRAGAPILNPVLGLVLRVEYRIGGLDALVERHLASAELSIAAASAILGEIESRCSALPGFTVAPRAVMGNFSYSAMPMVIDLEGNVAKLAASDLVASLAGVPEARRAVAASRVEVGPQQLDELGPEDQLLVLDADSTQLEAIRRVMEGESLVIQGPPGTGKSQTIVNMIASLVHAGKRVLLVAEKRVAIESVRGRLEQLGLGDILLDFRGGVGARNRLAQVIASPPSSAGEPEPSSDPELSAVRAALSAHVSDLHEPIMPGGPSRYEVYRRLLIGARPLRSPVAMPAVDAEATSSEQVDELAEIAEEWVRLGGPTLLEEYPEWAFLLDLTPDRIDGVRRAVDELGDRYLPAALEALRTAADEVRLEHPTTLEGWSELLALLRDVAEFATRFDPSIYKENLEATVLDLAPAEVGAMARIRAKLTSPRYREAFHSIRTVAAHGASGHELLEAATAAIEYKRQWVMRRRDGRLPRAPASLPEAEQALVALRAHIDGLADSFDVGPWLSGPVVDLESRIDRLRSDPVFADVTRIAELARRLDAAGLESVVAALVEGDIPPDRAGDAVRQAWLAGLLSAARRRSPGPFDGSLQSRRQREYRRRVRSAMEEAPRRVAEAVARRGRQAMAAHPEQVELLRAELAKDQGFASARAIVDRGAAVLGALRPCWMMSPLLVSEILPSVPDLFDVVVFDEASQVIPAEAIPSLARARQMVVVGDRRQLPPTTFFTRTVMDEEADDDTEDAPQFESILEASAQVTSEILLNRHYRSRDERLIAFSNERMYDGALRTFPGPGGTSPIEHLVVASPPTGHGTRSNPNEVERVVDLVLEQARERPHLSLGVITMGQAHADNIQQALRHRLGAVGSPELDAWFADRAVEPFFVKSLEQVQGDERDVVVLSTGYHKTPDGDLPQMFGPLLRSGGERRLNVAVTRSRVSLVVVTSFTAADLTPRRSEGPAVALLRGFLASLEHDQGASSPASEVDPVVADVGRQLSQAGVPVELCYGRSGYRIGVAARHPDEQDRFVLAIEVDDEVYRSEPTVRDRDMVVGETLERLGWRVHRIWVDDWMRDPKGETRRAVESWVEAVIAHDGGVDVTPDDSQEGTLHLV